MARFGDLPRMLWAGALPDPEAPGRAVAALVREGRYGLARDGLRRLADWRLPTGPGLDEALARWPWSIDLALIALDAAGDDDAARDAALAGLAARVAAQDRRRATLAWAAWRLGRASEARAALARLDPASPTHDEDLACRAELALRDADWPAAEADLAALGGNPALRSRLSLQAIHLRQGWAALAAHLSRAADLALSGVWRQGFDLLLAERDFAGARAHLARPGGSPATRADAALRLALDCGELVAATQALAAELGTREPWEWTARQHSLWLRLTLARARETADPHPLHIAAAAHADAAMRLFGTHAGLQALALTTRELTGDWDRLAADLKGLPRDPGAVWTAARGLNRLGLHEEAQRHLDAPGATGGVNARARRQLARAETALLAGDPVAALGALDAAGSPPAPTRADLALVRAEALLWSDRPTEAAAVLEAVATDFAQRMGLWLTLARARYFAADFDAAEAALERFRTLKTVQTGAPAPDDLRDRITADARTAAARLAAIGEAAGPHSLAPATASPAAAPIIAASPGLAAVGLSHAGPFHRPVAGSPIPRRLVHYWEGRRSHPVERGLSAWAARHPGFEQRVFDPPAVTAWLAANEPGLVGLFARQTLPATRADLFRAVWIAREGGLYADVDEYPRASVAPWLEGARAVLALESGYGTVANNFLAAVPGMPLFGRMLARVRDALERVETPYPWWDCGPAPLTLCVWEALRDPAEAEGLRLLRQADYCARVATNLPFPHKRGALHWR